jgi:hypothetical protein
MLRSHVLSRMPMLSSTLVAAALLVASFGLAAGLPSLKAKISFFNDDGAFLLDLGATSTTTGHSLGGKLANVVTGPGTAAFVKKVIPDGAVITFTVIKKGAYPEGTITFAGKDLGRLLVANKLAKPKAP